MKKSAYQKKAAVVQYLQQQPEQPSYWDTDPVTGDRGENNSTPPFSKIHPSSASVDPQSMTQSLNRPTRKLSTSVIHFVLIFDR
jgi:hypothetical protein